MIPDTSAVSPQSSYCFSEFYMVILSGREMFVVRVFNGPGRHHCRYDDTTFHVSLLNCLLDCVLAELPDQGFHSTLKFPTDGTFT